MSRPQGRSEPDRRATWVGLPAGTGEPTPVIAHRYRIINELGQGGMGAVYRVIDRLTGRVVTLKRLAIAPGSAADGAGSIDERASFAGEFEVLASLRHPNIIGVLDYGFETVSRTSR